MQDDQVGLGIDVVEIERMQRILQRSPGFVRIFSDEERAYCDAKPNPAVHYATRFAAKEAVLKALGTGFARGIHPRDVEVHRQPSGKPVCRLSGNARLASQKMGVIDLPISLSYTHEEAVACAMAITRLSTKAAMDRSDPMVELAQAFKQARGMLDEIDDKISPS